MNFLSCWRRIADAPTIRRCVLCHGSSGVSDGICAGCAADLAAYRTDAANSCPLCFRHVQGGAVCGGCQKKPPAFDRMWASLHYEPPVSNMIRALKHLADLGMAQPLADLTMQNPPDRPAFRRMFRFRPTRSAKQGAAAATRVQPKREHRRVVGATLRLADTAPTHRIPTPPPAAKHAQRRRTAAKHQKRL